jgi:hypothetical protein
MSFIVEKAGYEARREVQTRGLKFLLAGIVLALAPFVVAEVVAEGSVAGSIALAGLLAVGLPLAPIALVAGIIDTFWPRVDTCPSSGIEV